MKIVIDIPEGEYGTIKQFEKLGKYSDKNDAGQRALSRIANGTPLPKGHGDLIDRNDLDITTITTDDYSGNEVLDVILKEDLDDASTIIEADKAESEG